MKTNELTGHFLNVAVALAMGHKPPFGIDGFFPSTDWSQGGPIIEREKIGIVPSDDDANVWIGSMLEPEWKFNRTGPTPLIAAMRCYVASKMGEEINIPNEVSST